MSERIAELERAVQALVARVEALEQVDGLDHGLLRRLGAATGEAHRRGPVQGALTFAGSLRIDDRPLVWQRDLAAPALLDSPVEGPAAVLAALGHPDRLALARALLAGPRRGPELAGALGDASTGRLYHHLDKLTAAGVARQPERGLWEVVPEKVVPVLILIGAAADLHGGASGG